MTPHPQPRELCGEECYEEQKRATEEEEIENEWELRKGEQP